MRRQRSELLRDQRNLELLGYLRDHPRLSVAALARRIGMPAPAVRECILRLEEAGVIRGCRLDIDPTALGYAVCAFIRDRPGPGARPRIAELAQNLPEIVEFHRVTGEDRFVLKVHLPTLDQSDQVLDQFLALGQTRTNIVQSTPVPPRGLPLPGASH